ncbi:MAG: hypothetical protein ACFBSG_02910 [Leptolyngbyaceae cyanobacterium]
MRTWAKVSLGLWSGLTAWGWLWYWPFVSGHLWGWHALAWLYGQLVWISVFGLFAIAASLPIIGLAFGVLGLISQHRAWRPTARRGAKILVVSLLIELMAIMLLLPPLFSNYWPQTRLAIAPWQQTFHTIYVGFTFDDNYGDLMLLRCHRLGLCHQVYRRYTDTGSAEQATLQMNADKTAIGLRLEGQWVYVTSQTAPLCDAARPAGIDYGKCTLEP